MSLSLSSLTGVTFTATSGNPPVSIGTQTIPVTGLSLGANSVQITNSDILTALESGTDVNPVNISLTCSYADGLSLVETTGTPYVPPPPPIMLDTNNVTLKYTLPEIPSGSPNPYIVNVSGTDYAIMSDSQDSIDKIKAYAKNINNTPFIPDGQSSPVPFSNIVTTLMTDMSGMFHGAQTFNEDISTWDTSNVTNMSVMFDTAVEFNGDISKWNTSSVLSMGNMFAQAFNFNIPITTNGDSWNVSKVTNMFNMFATARIFNQDISNWNTSSVLNMGYMFFGALAFNQDISVWNVSSVISNPMPGFSDYSGLIPDYIPNFTN
jgi:surface protein